MMIVLLAFLLLAPLAHAQELLLAQTAPPRLEWSYQGAPDCTLATPTIDVQSSQTFVGTYTRVVQLPIPATTYMLPTTANNLYYRVATACGESNIVQYVATVPPPTGPTLDQRVTTLETSVAALRLADQALSAVNVAQDMTLSSLTTRIAVLESDPPQAPPPAPASNFTITHIDATHIRIVCNGIGITTLGSGTSRTMECRQ